MNDHDCTVCGAPVRNGRHIFEPPKFDLGGPLPPTPNLRGVSRGPARCRICGKSPARYCWVYMDDRCRFHMSQVANMEGCYVADDWTWHSRASHYRDPDGTTTWRWDCQGCNPTREK